MRGRAEPGEAFDFTDNDRESHVLVTNSSSSKLNAKDALIAVARRLSFLSELYRSFHISFILSIPYVDSCVSRSARNHVLALDELDPLGKFAGKIHSASTLPSEPHIG